MAGQSGEVGGVYFKNRQRQNISVLRSGGEFQTGDFPSPRPLQKAIQFTKKGCLGHNVFLNLTAPLQTLVDLKQVRVNGCKLHVRGSPTGPSIVGGAVWTIVACCGGRKRAAQIFLAKNMP